MIAQFRLLISWEPLDPLKIPFLSSGPSGPLMMWNIYLIIYSRNVNK